MIRRIAWFFLIAVAACGTPDAAADPPGTDAAALPTEAAGDAVLGTIEATVDGRALTWYVVSGEIRGSPYASGAWYEPEANQMLASIGGFDTRTPPFDSFEQGANGAPVSFGEYTGPVLSLVLATEGSPAPYRREFGSAAGGTAMVYMPEARFDDISVIYIAESGFIDVASIALTNGRLTARGTFAGTFANTAGATVTVTDGRFAVAAVPALSEISGGAAGR